MPPEILPEFLRAGLLGAIAIVLAYALYRKDQQVTVCHELRVAEQKESAALRAADALRSADVIEKQNQAALAGQRAAEERGRVMEMMSERLRVIGEEQSRSGRRVDQIANRLRAGEVAE